MKKTIIIFGLCGSGKSTMAKRVGNRFKLRVIHPSGIIRQLLSGHNANTKTALSGRGFWESKTGIKLFKDRLTEEKPIDLIVDKILLKEVNKENVVIDSWNLPWLSKKGLKIYLKAPLTTRAERVAKRSKLSTKQALKIVKMKDEKTRQLFKKFYGFDIKKDLNVFHNIVNTRNLNKRQVFDNIKNIINNF